MSDDGRRTQMARLRAPWRSRILALSLMILVGALVINRGRLAGAVHDAFAPAKPEPAKIIIVAPIDARTV